MTYQYWHTFDFPEFTTTGLDQTPEKLKAVKLPEDMKDMSVLDIGAWDGYFSFICEKRGANKVVAYDSPLHSWNKKSITIQSKEILQDGKEGFETAKNKLNSKVIDVEGELDDLLQFKKDNFDVVLCLGILYHVKDPYKLIRDLYEITGKKLFLETHIDLNEAPMPVMRFYSNAEVNKDEGTFWGPNMLCVYEMLRKAGFKNIEADYVRGRGIFRAEK